MRFGAAHRKLWGSVSCLAVLLGLLVAGCGGGSTPPPASASIAANGAVRASNTVTITTTATHSLVVGQAVVISGVTDASFNSTFSIATVPSSTTFTYSQTGANATSGGGTVSTFAVT